ncbi:MAG: hypothetical protein WBJ84_10105 [Bacteroidales bacterium]
MIRNIEHNLPSMRNRGVDPMLIIEINDIYVLGIYQGSFSNKDIYKIVSIATHKRR